MVSYVVHPFERGLGFQITSQSSLASRVLDNFGGVFRHPNGWSIKISESPEANPFTKTIYLRGSDAEKNFVIDRTWDFSSNAERDEMIWNIKETLDTFNLSYVPRPESHCWLQTRFNALRPGMKPIRAKRPVRQCPEPCYVLVDNCWSY